jgi:hypothetical protein
VLSTKRAYKPEPPEWRAILCIFIMSMIGQRIPRYTLKVKSKKVKLSLCFNWVPYHEGVLSSEGKAPCTLDLGTRWRWVISFTSLPIYPQGKSSWCPLDRRLGGPQCRSGLSGVEKNSSLCWDSNPQIIQLVAQRYTTELSWLLDIPLIQKIVPKYFSYTADWYMNREANKTKCDYSYVSVG